MYDTKKGFRTTSERPGRSRIGNRRPVNRYSIEKETESVSMSAKKLKMIEKDYEIQTNPTFGYCFIDFVTVFSSISQLVVCKKMWNKCQF